MATAAEIIESALRKLGVIASGEDPSSAEQADGLASLNQMLASFSNESIFLFSDNEETFTLTPSTSSYTMGSGGDFNTTQPIKITDARLQVNTSNPAYEMPISILTLPEWKKIVQKNISSTLPSAIYVEYGAALATINVYPVPSAAQSLILNSRKVVQSFASAATAVAMPPGYERLLVFNLAVEVASEYGQEASPTVQRIAKESKAMILRNNSESPILKNEIADLINGAPFNWLTGQ